MKKILYIVAFYMFVLMQPDVFARSSMIDMKAPELVISEWINNDPGGLKDMRGKVIVINFFQMKGVGYKSFSIPLMCHWGNIYSERDDIIFLFIYSPFERHQDQEHSFLKEYVLQNEITHSVGVDAFAQGGSIPVTMKIFKIGGTPCIVIVDKRGVIRFKQMGNFNADVAKKLIDKLLW
ncbi:MAG: hypothetical protein GY941_20795 [Planctomycetes bacterium]|nr:hypothetical protein [Planctomycetota bacterium]